MTASPLPENNNLDSPGRQRVPIVNSRQSPVRLLLALALTIFVSECLVMLFLAYLGPLSAWSGALLDASLMMVLLSPGLYLLVFRPLIQLVEERKRAEEALEPERKRLKGILDTMGNSVYIVNPRGEIEYLNPMMVKEFGPVNGRKCYEYFHDRPDPCPWCRNDEVFAGKSIRWESSFSKTGKTYDLFDTPFPNPDGTVSKLEIFHDITQRKKAEESLRSSEQRYRTLVDSMDDAVFALDREQRLGDVFGPLLEKMGLNAGLVKGKTPREMLGPDLAAIHENASRRVLEGEHVVYEWSFLGPAGSMFLQTSLSPIRKSEKEIEGMVGVTRDITGQKLLEKQLIQTEKLMAVGQVAAMISHEFRNALTSLRMILELQAESKNLSGAERKSIAVALNSVSHMEGIVTDLLNFARPVPMVFHEEDLNNLVEESLAFLDLRIVREQIQITKALDTTLPRLSVDAQHFKEVLINLLLNAADAIAARDYPPIPRTISIMTGRHVLQETLRDLPSTVEGGGNGRGRKIQRDLELVLQKGTECACIEIRDTGVGIGAEHRNRIFDPFFTTKSSGTGLGLPMVQRTVHAHGGIITVESKMDEGTTFRIYLPVSHGK